MEWQDIKKLVEQGESETLELKKSTAQLNRACETLCGMLNGNGGAVLIGVTPKGKIIGQEVTDHTRQEIAEALKRFEPQAHQAIQIEYISLPDRPNYSLIAMLAFASAALRPFCWDGRPWQRVQSSTQQMTQQTYLTLLRQREHHHFRWDHLPAEDYAVEQLDRNRIQALIEQGTNRGRLPEAARHEAYRAQLQRLHLLDPQGRVTRAAAVLFGTDFFSLPQCQLRLARFKGTDKQQYADQKQLTGNAFLLLETAMDFLRQHLPVAGTIQPGLLTRDDQPLFPLEALREALANAFCHRDYQHPGGAVSIAIYDDRLEIWNPGQLSSELSLEQLKQEHSSIPRNPLIADLFYLAGLIEKWGRGTQLIVQKSLEAGHPEPEFLHQSGSFVVRFPIADYHPPYRTHADLSSLHRAILQRLANQEPLSFQQLHLLAPDMPERSFREALMLLKQLGLIRLEGHGRGARWWLVRK
jgi:ATP-dependent DNA helicase RecG